MSNSFIARAEQIAGLITEAVDAAQIITHDPAVIDRRGAGPAGAVLVFPAPDMELGTDGRLTYSWTIFVLARPGKALDSLASIGTTLDQLRAAGIAFDKAEPGAYTSISDNPVELPGYVLTITDPHLTS